MVHEQVSARQSMEPKVCRPMMKQSTFNWDTKDKYNKLKNFRLEINNVFKLMSGIEKAAIIKNWLGRKGLYLLETLTEVEQEKCETSEGLFHTLSSKFKFVYNEIIKSLQFCKLVRQSNKNVEKWMGRLRIAAIECSYKEIDRQLKEQFIHGLNDSDMIIDTIKELTKWRRMKM